MMLQVPTKPTHRHPLTHKPTPQALGQPLDQIPIHLRRSILTHIMLHMHNHRPRLNQREHRRQRHRVHTTRTTNNRSALPITHTPPTGQLTPPAQDPRSNRMPTSNQTAPQAPPIAPASTFTILLLISTHDQIIL